MSLLNDHYKLIKKIGAGGFSTIYLAENHLGEQFAIKSLKIQNTTHIDYYRREAMIHQRLARLSPNVVPLYDIIEEEDYVHFVLEYFPDGDLFETLLQQTKTNRYYSERTIKSMIYTLLETIQLIHSKDIVHRDLKLENLLVQKYEGFEEIPSIKVADFGLAREEIRGNNLSGLAGTPLYMAPEIHRQEAYGKPIDIWAIGVIAYGLFCGNLPFGNDEHTCKSKILSREFHFRGKEWLKVSALGKDFIKNLLNFDPRLRLTAEEALLHPWFHFDEPEEYNTSYGFQQFTTAHQQGMILASPPFPVSSSGVITSDSRKRKFISGGLIREEAKRRKEKLMTYSPSSSSCCSSLSGCSLDEDDEDSECLNFISHLCQSMEIHIPTEKPLPIIPSMQSIFTIFH